jgi:hypothetical protein
MRGLDPRIHLVRKKLFAKADGLPGHKRVTRVFNALCPAMTACKGRVCAPFAHPTLRTIESARRRRRHPHSGPLQRLPRTTKTT